MQTMLYVAAILTIVIGVIHSVLGEKYILTRLFRRDNLPKLFGSSDFTINTLRFAWHITTIAWWGFAAILVLLANPPVSSDTLGAVIAVTFTVHFLIAAIASKGKHLSWIVFLLIGLFTYIATRH
ncbi:MAG: hypothetical protein ACFHVJ_11615 [Aestuariibacter sp.]